MRRLLALFLLAVPGMMTAPLAHAATCQKTVFEDVPFTFCEVGAADDLRLFLDGADGPHGQFGTLERALAADGEALGMAMNAGMYHRDRTPVGLFIADGVERSPLVTAPGPGNFGMLPNGVFCWGDGHFRVIESRAFHDKAPACRFATQSGPMLVIDGAIHPRFIPDSDSVFIRNGVGVPRDESRAVLAISDRPVNFHRFARFFRDALGMENALYFDGKISRLYAPALNRHDRGLAMGPIIGTVIAR